MQAVRLNNGAKINNTAPGSENALLKAVKNHHVALALRLLQRGAEYDGKDKDGNTVLMLSAACEAEELVEALLKKPQISLYQVNKRGENVFDIASRTGNRTLIKMIEDKK